MPVPPDPATPGLLDLLTVAALGEQAMLDPESPSPTFPDEEAEERPAARRPALTSSTPSGSRRLWVEVEV